VRMPCPADRHLDPFLAADPDRRLTNHQVREFLGVSADRLKLLDKLGVLKPVERGPNGKGWYRLEEVRAAARGERAMPAPGIVLAGGELR
jgi:hypothetical protein